MMHLAVVAVLDDMIRIIVYNPMLVGLCISWVGNNSNFSVAEKEEKDVQDMKSAPRVKRGCVHDLHPTECPIYERILGQMLTRNDV